MKEWKILTEDIDLPDFGAGLLWSSIAFSKNRLRSDMDFGTLAEAGGDYTFGSITKYIETTYTMWTDKWKHTKERKEKKIEMILCKQQFWIYNKTERKKFNNKNEFFSGKISFNWMC